MLLLWDCCQGLRGVINGKRRVILVLRFDIKPISLNLVEFNLDFQVNHYLLH